MLTASTILLATTTASCIALLMRNTKLRADLATARHEADHDALTGLPNRRALLRHLNTLLADPARPVAVALLDLNRFKEINDEHGHTAGDLVLCQVANTLTALDLSRAKVGRMGGDEFMIITDDGMQTARINAKAAAQALDAATVALGETNFGCYASLGLALADHNEVTAADLLSRADAAMYAAKRRGGGVKEWHPNIGATVTTKRPKQRRRYR
ncbi:GGDEF domain-containing protein [Micromonospora peucetia]|uniref:Diguanylate cyclase (GGDEF) domain-containing protein n=1 Tax=Micromonospora peucetia TaxID=47871 RepID=A0A1C6W521_9ACTN|nr:GGDEF domain-containing protein [Micromonospora peucetia]SCL73633.1 diguanylate cyclase (GGDEF) domain-containing protein [Micromonospora peucetia]